MRAKVLNIADIWLFSDWGSVIPWDSRTWVPHYFSVSSSRTGKLRETRATVVVFDKNREIKIYSRNTGLSRKKMELRYLEFNSLTGLWEETDTHNSFELEITEPYGKYPYVQIECSAMSGLRRTAGPPVASRTCKHIYKGIRCQSTSSDPVCPKDREHCKLVKLNVIHFGGLNWGAEPGTEFGLGPLPDSPIGGKSWPIHLGGDSGTEAEVAMPPLIYDTTRPDDPEL